MIGLIAGLLGLPASRVHPSPSLAMLVFIVIFLVLLILGLTAVNGRGDALDVPYFNRPAVHARVRRSRCTGER